MTNTNNQPAKTDTYRNRLNSIPATIFREWDDETDLELRYRIPPLLNETGGWNHPEEWVQ